jgi:hypothetical protein
MFDLIGEGKGDIDGFSAGRRGIEGEKAAVARRTSTISFFGDAVVCQGLGDPSIYILNGRDLIGLGQNRKRHDIQSQHGAGAVDLLFI